MAIAWPGEGKADPLSQQRRCWSSWATRCPLGIPGPSPEVAPRITYLDHAGATLFPDSLLKAFTEDLRNNVYGNPHSQNISSKLTYDTIEHVRYRCDAVFGGLSVTSKENTLLLKQQVLGQSNIAQNQRECGCDEDAMENEFRRDLPVPLLSKQRSECREWHRLTWTQATMFIHVLNLNTSSVDIIKLLKRCYGIPKGSPRGICASMNLKFPVSLLLRGSAFCPCPYTCCSSTIRLESSENNQHLHGGFQLAAFSRYVQLLSEGIAALVQIGAFLFGRQGSCSASKQSNVLNTRGSSASASITAAVLSRRNGISRIQAQGNGDRQRVMMCKLASLAQAAAALGDILKNSCVTSLMSCHCLRKIDLEISPADSEYLLEKQQSLTSSQVPALRIFERDAVDIGIV
ncbi:Molybdenum cofactor sulfurase [Anas platyrhynchos]|uniref:Molybdenum cofactor sulfurase n=1 Tax=Anas platyrhynchos TaxID=8839 RepID=R0LB23_ANAPL|nr:Molybdenum cofactor sulfurase [Anas platyrhynchos]